MVQLVVDRSRYTMHGVGGSVNKPLESAWSMWYVGSPVTGNGVILEKRM